MSDFIYPYKNDKNNQLLDPAATRFHPKTDGIVDCIYNFTANLKSVKDDLAKYNTLRTYLQAYLQTYLRHSLNVSPAIKACLRHSLNVSPKIITMEHLDTVFEQHILNMSNYVAPGQKTSPIEIINILLNGLTQNWLDLPIKPAIKQAVPYSQSNCTGISFVLMPRKQQNHVFYDLRQTTQLL